MAIATEQIAERAWVLPESRVTNGATVSIRTDIKAKSPTLNAQEMTDLNIGVYEFAGEIGAGANETARIWGYDFQRGKKPNTYTIRHIRQDGTRITGNVRVDNKGPFLPEIVLFKAKKESKVRL
jgi:hypothetical protein